MPFTIAWKAPSIVNVNGTIPVYNHEKHNNKAVSQTLFSFLVKGKMCVSLGDADIMDLTMMI